MARMQSGKPTRKVLFGGMAGAIVTILIWVIESIANTKVPGAVAAAMTTVITAVVSYFIPPADDDQIVST